MVSPYRAGESPKAPTCPRCKKPLPPTDVAACPKGCGTWASAFAATIVLTETDRKPDPLTRWWRVREPCPLCGDKMQLCGEEPGLLQGCDLHGYFVDADTIQHTGLAKQIDTAALADPARLAAYSEQRETLENERAADAEKRAKYEEDSRKTLAARQETHEIADAEAVAALPSKQYQVYGSTLGPLVRYIFKLEARLAAAEARLDAIERQPTS